MASEYKQAGVVSFPDCDYRVVLEKFKNRKGDTTFFAHIERSYKDALGKHYWHTIKSADDELRAEVLTQLLGRHFV